MELDEEEEEDGGETSSSALPGSSSSRPLSPGLDRAEPPAVRRQPIPQDRQRRGGDVPRAPDGTSGRLTSSCSSERP